MSKLKTIARNLVLQSPLSGRYYFVAKAEVLGNGGYRVIGVKVDVSESIESLLRPLLRKERRAKRVQK